MSKREFLDLVKFVFISVFSIFVALHILNWMDSALNNPKMDLISTDDNVYEFVEKGENYTDPVELEKNYKISYTFYVEPLDNTKSCQLRYIFTGGEKEEEIDGCTFDLKKRESGADVEFNFLTEKNAVEFYKGQIDDRSYHGNVETNIKFDTYPENLKISFTGTNIRISQLSLSGRVYGTSQLFFEMAGSLLYMFLTYCMITIMFSSPLYFSVQNCDDSLIYGFRAIVLAVSVFLITALLSIRFLPGLWSLINSFTLNLYDYRLTIIENAANKPTWFYVILIFSFIAGTAVTIMEQIDLVDEGRVYSFLAMLLSGFVRLLSVGFMIAIIIGLLDTIIQLAVVIGLFVLAAAAGSGGTGSSSPAEGYHFAGRYSNASTGYGSEYVVVSKNDSNGNPYAVLRDGHGNNVTVRPVNPGSSNGILKDDAGNSYYPR